MIIDNIDNSYYIIHDKLKENWVNNISINDTALNVISKIEHFKVINKSEFLNFTNHNNRSKVKICLSLVDYPQLNFYCDILQNMTFIYKQSTKRVKYSSLRYLLTPNLTFEQIDYEHLSLRSFFIFVLNNSDRKLDESLKIQDDLINPSKLFNLINAHLHSLKTSDIIRNEKINYRTVDIFTLAIENFGTQWISSFFNKGFTTKGEYIKVVEIFYYALLKTDLSNDYFKNIFSPLSFNGDIEVMLVNVRILILFNKTENAKNVLTQTISHSSLSNSEILHHVYKSINDVSRHKEYKYRTELISNTVYDIFKDLMNEEIDSEFIKKWAQFLSLRKDFSEPNDYLRKQFSKNNIHPIYLYDNIVSNYTYNGISNDLLNLISDNIPYYKAISHSFNLISLKIIKGIDLNLVDDISIILNTYNSFSKITNPSHLHILPFILWAKCFSDTEILDLSLDIANSLSFNCFNDNQFDDIPFHNENPSNTINKDILLFLKS